MENTIECLLERLSSLRNCALIEEVGKSRRDLTTVSNIELFEVLLRELCS